MLWLYSWYSYHFLISKNIFFFSFFLVFLFVYVSVITPPSRVSAADSRLKLDVYISIWHGAAKGLFINITAKIQAWL
jgi:hypothetical protein